LLAKAPGYQRAGLPLGKSENTLYAPADPSTPLVDVQASGLKLASTWIGTSEFRRLPQMSATTPKTIWRCSPSVVPGLPPIGATGVGSLKPTLAASRFHSTNDAACASVTLPAARSATPRRRSALRCLAIICTSRGLVVQRVLRGGFAVDALCRPGAVGVAVDHRERHALLVGAMAARAEARADWLPVQQCVGYGLERHAAAGVC